MKKNNYDKRKKSDRLTIGETMEIRQNSEYGDSGKAAADNNIFWENKSNPLSSKGN